MKAIIFLVLVSTAITQNYAQDKNIFYSNFDNLDSFAEQILRLKHVSLAKNEGVNNTSAIKVSYIPSSEGSERVTSRFKLDKRYKEVTLNFDVKYHKDFDWAKGGKLHGVGPQKPITGGNKTTIDGWSSRLMFYAKGSLGTYVYNQSKNKKYGESKLAKIKMKADRYYAISLYTKVNTPGNDDGEILCYVDGELKIKLKKQTLRGKVAEGAAQIETILFHTFHGGSTSSWTPKKNGKPAVCYAFFDNFAAYEGLKVRTKPGE